ncbi:MAG: hypothetical protein GXY50_05500 [Syntrophomonadaceae bacterium]|nr:hypothetical protein [Syntrophomonadaceae bacterium]
MRMFDDDDRSGFHYEMLTVPWAFLNGLFIGGWLLRQGRRSWEKGPRD